MVQPGESGSAPSAITKPHPDAAAKRGKSRANPSDKSIMAAGLKKDTNQLDSFIRGVKSRCFPCDDPPRDPVTSRICPGVAVERRVRLVRRTVPVAAIEMTGAESGGTRVVSPPASVAPKDCRQAPMPR